MSTMKNICRSMLKRGMLILAVTSSFAAQALISPDHPVKKPKQPKPLEQNVAQASAAAGVVDGQSINVSSAAPKSNGLSYSAGGHNNAQNQSNNGANNDKSGEAKRLDNPSNAIEQSKPLSSEALKTGQLNSRNTDNNVQNRLNQSAQTLGNKPLAAKDKGKTTRVLETGRINNGPAAISPEKLKQIEKLIGKGKVNNGGQDKNSLKRKRDTDEKAKLTQGLIDAQINDVLGSEEFIELEQSDVFAKPTGKKPAANDKKTKGTDSEATLLLLDQSNLMDYVAEDDFWKEQLTIEDEPG